MRTIVIPDIHGRSSWKIPAYNEKWDRFIFIGDYFDSYDLTTVEQIHNFKEIIEFKKNSDKEVILLIGNHDSAYLPETIDPYMQGFQFADYGNIGPVLIENKKHLRIAYRFDNFLFTHAGVSEIFLKNANYDTKSFDDIVSNLTGLWMIDPKEFKKKPGDSDGNSPYQSPLWIRPEALKLYSKKIKKSGLIQIVGHTSQELGINLNDPSYYFIDALGTTGEYLIIENNKITTGKI